MPASLLAANPGGSRRRRRLRWLPLRDGQARGHRRRDDRRERRTAVRLRHRPERQALQPARADHRQLAQRAAADRDRCGHRRGRALRRRRHDPGQGQHRPRPSLHHHRARRDPRRLTGQRNHRRCSTWRPRRRCSASKAATAASRWSATPNVTPRAVGDPDQAAALPDADGADLGRAGQLRQQVRHGRDGRPALHPARFRRDRTVRRRIRHLQHHLDDGRTADARVRDAAHAGCLPAAGAALGAARERGDRRRWPPCSGSGSASSCSRRSSALFKGLPQAGTVISPQTVVVTMAVGTGVTLARRPLPGAPGDACRADLGRARRRGPARRTVRAGTSRTSPAS